MNVKAYDDESCHDSRYWSSTKLSNLSGPCRKDGPRNQANKVAEQESVSQNFSSFFAQRGRVDWAVAHDSELLQKPELSEDGDQGLGKGPPHKGFADGPRAWLADKSPLHSLTGILANKRRKVVRTPAYSCLLSSSETDIEFMLLRVSNALRNSGFESAGAHFSLCERLCAPHRFFRRYGCPFRLGRYRVNIRIGSPRHVSW